MHSTKLVTSNSTQLSKNTSHKHKKNTTKKSPSKKRSNSLEIVDAQSNKLLALYFIKVLCLSATALQSQPKQKARSAIHRFYFFDDFLLSRDLQVDVHLREIDRISAALIVNFVWGHAPNPPVILKEGESPPSKSKFKQLLTTFFADLRTMLHTVFISFYISSFIQADHCVIYELHLRNSSVDICATLNIRLMQYFIALQASR